MKVFEWLIHHYGVVSAIASTATLCVWILYLQLFYNSYRHQIRAKILITRGGGHTLRSRCIITNMSPELVFISAILLELRFENEVVRCSLSDTDPRTTEGRDRRSELFQGPLKSGEYLDIGSFEEMIAAALADCGRGEEAASIDHLAVVVAGRYIWHDKLVAAERRFDVFEIGAARYVEPQERDAVQIRTRAGRNRIYALLEEHARRPPIRPKHGTI